MSLYYRDESVTLYHGDSLEVLPTLDIVAGVLLTDPPYFKVKDEEWDNQWDEAAEFLQWLGLILDKAKPLLTENASAWVFASPAMTSSVERLVGERFRVLNSVRWVKEAGWHQRQHLGVLRSFLSAWEGIVFAEQSAHPASPLASYIRAERRRAGLSGKDVAKHFPSASGGLTGCVSNWESGGTIPTQETYDRLREILNEGSRAGFLAADYEALRRPFRIPSRSVSTDIWSFDPVTPSAGKHPCEKPEAMLRHMIEVSSRRGDIILDPFAGSGATLLAASRSGRRAVGIEKDERWCEHAANRLSQGTLDIFGAA